MANKTDETYYVFVRLKNNDQAMKTIYNNNTKINSLSASHRNASLKKMDCNAGSKEHQIKNGIFLESNYCKPVSQLK